MASIQLADTALEQFKCFKMPLGFVVVNRLSVVASMSRELSNTYKHPGYLSKLSKASLSNTWLSNQKWRYVLEVAPVFKCFVWASFVPLTVECDGGT